MERLDFSSNMTYNAIEAAIHMNRYLAAKQYVQGKRVLDVACGEGYGTRLLKSWGAAEVIGVDISAEAIEKASALFSAEGVQFLRHAAEQLPFENDSFDVIVSFETIEHVDSPERFLEEIRRVVKFSGTVLLSCPNDYLYEEKLENYSNPFHKHRWHWYEIKELGEKYLGNDASWYFGFALNGFTNIPESLCTYPEKDALPTSMMGMMQGNRLENVNIVQSDRYLNQWNSNYFLGIWGQGSRQLKPTATIFPREYFVDPTDVIWSDLPRIAALHAEECRVLEEKARSIQAQLEMIQKQWEEAETIWNEQREQTKRKIHVLEIEKERTSQLLVVTKEENDSLWKRVGHLEWLNSEAEKVRTECETWRVQCEQMRPEYEYMQYLRGTKAFKAVQLFWRCKDAVKRLFHIK